MHNKPVLAILMTVAVIISGCTENIQEQTPKQEEALSVTVKDPVCGEMQTKAINSSFAFSFAENDKINVYSAQLESNAAMTYYLSPKAGSPKSASFKPSAFSLKDGTYCAVYPGLSVSDSPKDVSLSFVGQSQSENGSADHLAKYDYNCASANITDNTGLFSLEHKVSWLKAYIQVPDAAVLQSIVVSADDGVADEVSLNAIDGSVSISKSASDFIYFDLGGEDGISVEAGGTLTAFITLPADTYSNLCLLAVDSEGHKYSYSAGRELTFLEGVYYSPTLTRTDIPETTPFTRQSSPGMYGETDSEYPPAMFIYDDAHQQMSYGKGNGYRTFKLADLERNIYAIFTVSPKNMAIGEMYTVSADVNGTKTQSDCKCVNIAGSCVWLEDKKTNIGYVFNIE